MILLPTRRTLVRKRDSLYLKLQRILQFCSVSQLEDIMRKIHHINNRLRFYDESRERHYNYEDDITQDPIEDEEA